MYIGGPDGLIAFNPEGFTSNPTPPSTVISNLQAYGEEVTIAGNISGPVNLTHDKNELTFSYVGLHFTDPSQNQYTYSPEGYDTDWRDAGTLRRATYTNFSSGDYTFHVRSASSDGIWDDDGASLAVLITPPWWATSWAYILYGIVFIGGFVMVDRVRRCQVQAREQEKARER